MNRVTQFEHDYASLVSGNPAIPYSTRNGQRRERQVTSIAVRSSKQETRFTGYGRGWKKLIKYLRICLTSAAQLSTIRLGGLCSQIIDR
jgi:hypothetical protein